MRISFRYARSDGARERLGRHSGEVIDPGFGVVGTVQSWWINPDELQVEIDLDEKKVAERLRELERPGGVF